ncbi:MAG: leucine-rich repeat protein [Clostridiales bacterium]|nr:leucine-rich repeat protein [Clostridiales bacterium]
MKKLLAIMLALIMVLAMVPALADDPLSGNCGVTGNEASVTWKLKQNNTDTANPTYTLTISGSGAMADYNGWRSQPWKGYAEEITKFVVEDDVTVIGQSATDGLIVIAEYDIGKSVETIKDFGISTYSATTFNLNGNTNFKVVDGVLFSADGTTLYAYPGGRAEIDVYNVPSDVTRINGGAFNGAKMKKLIFGDNNIYIQSWGFQGCTAEYMELNGTKLSGSESFRGLSKLKYLKIAGGNIPGQFFCGVAWTGGPSTAAIEKISISELPTGSRPFFLQNKLTTVDLSQCGNVGNASEGPFKDTQASMIAFYFDKTENAESFKNTSTDAYESTNAVFAVLNDGSIPSTEGWYKEGQFVLATPVKEGYRFEGWYKNADLSGDPVTTVEEAGGTYYAKWVATQVEFLPGDGRGVMPGANLDANNTLSFPACTFTAPADKEFAGWKITKPEGDTALYQPGDRKTFTNTNTGDYIDVEVTPDVSNRYEDKIIVTAQWRAIQQQPSGGGNGGGYYHPTTTPVPVIVIPPKTGDMTVWQSILHFLGIR